MEKAVSTPVHFMMLPPRQQLMLPPPTNLPQLTYTPPTRNSNSSYDILVTSNAPALKMLSMVERRGSRWRVKDP